MNERKKSDGKNPYDSANLLSRFFLCWTGSFVFKIYKNKGAIDTLCDCVAEDDCRLLGSRIENELALKKKTISENEKEPHISKILFKCINSSRIICCIILAMLTGICKGGLLLYSLTMYVKVIQDPSASSQEVYLTSCFLSVAVLLSSSVNTFNLFYSTSTGLRIGSALSFVVYNKCLRLSIESLADTSIGQIITTLSTDIKKIEVFFTILAFVLCGITDLVCGIIMLWPYMKVSTLSGLTVVLLFIPYWILMLKRISTQRHLLAEETEKRTRLLSDIISGIRVIKMYAWEDSFGRMLKSIRRKELRRLWYFCFLKSLNFAFYLISDKVVILVCFLTFSYVTSLPITLEIIFRCYIIFNDVKNHIFFGIPMAVSYGADSIAALQRIQKLILVEEKCPSANLKHTATQKNLPVQLTLHNVKAKWNSSKDEMDMSQVSISVAPGERRFVTGKVGSGKSSFLLSLIGECPIISGEVEVNGKIAYVPQESWLVSGTIRENVTMWEDFRENHYRKVLDICALSKDIEQFPDGDMTLVGERGVQLSGGQKARVNLARAVYTDSDIYLLDDPLSAVDAEVANYLFKRVIQEFLKEKICVLVTHQVQFLSEASHIIVLKKGQVAISGNYSQLLTYDTELLGIEHQQSNESSTICYKRGEKTPNLNDTVEIINSIPKDEADLLFNMLDAYLKYVKAIGGSFICLILSFAVLSQCLMSLSDFWFFMWLPYFSSVNNSSVDLTAINNVTIIVPYMQWAYFDKPAFNVLLCIGIFAGGFFFYTISTSIFYVGGLRASKKIHQTALIKVLHSKTSFFDKNSDGTILSRMTRDMSVVDEDIPYYITECSKLFLGNLASLCIGVLVIYWILVPILVLIVAVLMLLSAYKRVSRNIKIIEMKKTADLFSHVTTTIRGLAVIRTFNGQGLFLEKYCCLQNMVTSSRFLCISVIRWFSSQMQNICDLYVISIIWAAALYSEIIGLSTVTTFFGIITAFSMIFSFQYSINLMVELDAQMISVERIGQLEKLPSQFEMSCCQPLALDPDWPQRGEITFKDVSLTYTETVTPALKTLNFRIRPQEKVGIVGRTGSGKSSLVAAMFRLVDVDGIITVDHVPIQDVNITHLRNKLSIIPQDPVLFTGTIRSNLDPNNEFPDYRLWNALEKVYLKEVMQKFSEGLSTQIFEGGSHFSVGERQLFCLARAVLRNNRILILDEATASVDLRTDSLIQNTIRERFAQCTVLTIAHRLQTVMDCERVMVMDEGRLVEFDAPYVLLRREGSKFNSIIQQFDASTQNTLSDIAHRSYFSRCNGNSSDIIDRF